MPSSSLERAHSLQNLIWEKSPSTTLVIVSKTRTEAEIRPLLEGGFRHFGENRVQEAASKWPLLKEEYPDIILHLIGTLQSNKVKQAISLFDVIQTLDRPSLAHALFREKESSALPKLMIQMNTGEEPQKGGISPEAFPAFLTLCTQEYHLPLQGLMCIPPVDESPTPHFRLLNDIANQYHLENLSMGMSDDFEDALPFKPTFVRLGSAIFGPRPSP